MNQNTYRKSSRDYTVELWRFIFCMVVLGFHFFIKTKYSYFRAGYLGVEFFFVLSGYGIYSYYVKQMQGKRFGDRLYALGTYIGKRLIRLYPLYLLSLLCMLIFRVVSEQWNLSKIWAYITKGWAEFLMLQCGPLGNAVLISAHWYVAAFFWGSVILICVLMLTGRVGGYVICPLGSVLIYRYYFHLIGKIDVIYSYHAVVRAVAGLALGIFIGFVAQFLWEVSFDKEQGQAWKKGMRYALYLLANLLLAGVVIYTNFGRRSKIDFLVIAVYAVAVLVLFTVRIPLGEKKKALFARLSGVTYPIYLFQMPIIELIFWLLAMISK
ncbi:MAG: hypothetical protein E7289_00025 [Lachnospiraceae bacterium]|nr:hypothetical protein [Lachnospiraceae bacterium]